MYLNLLGSIDLLIDVLLGLDVDCLKGWLRTKTKVSRMMTLRATSQSYHVARIDIIQVMRLFGEKSDSTTYKDVGCGIRGMAVDEWRPKMEVEKWKQLSCPVR